MRLLGAYQQLHQQGQFPGWAIRPFVGRIATLIEQTGATSLLDYGCGEGKQYSVEHVHHRWGIMPALYEPARPEYSAEPSPADGVICTDVLEHVPEEEVPALCARLCGLARKFLFVSVCCRPAKRLLPDGRNSHVTLKSVAWWAAQFAAHATDSLTVVLVETP